MNKNRSLVQLRRKKKHSLEVYVVTNSYLVQIFFVFSNQHIILPNLNTLNFVLGTVPVNLESSKTLIVY